jgi:hypothetical protein
MVGMLLGLAECPEPADAADALAVALCHAQSCRAKERLARGTGITVGTGSTGASRARRIPVYVQP